MAIELPENYRFCIGPSYDRTYYRLVLEEFRRKKWRRAKYRDGDDFIVFVCVSTDPEKVERYMEDLWGRYMSNHYKPTGDPFKHLYGTYPPKKLDISETRK